MGHGRSEGCMGHGRSEGCMGHGRSEGCMGHGRSEMLQANYVHPFSTAHYEIMHFIYHIHHAFPTRGRALLHSEQRRAGCA
jgi:hypothetical protein